jgi:hypothetical protein
VKTSKLALAFWLALGAAILISGRADAPGGSMWALGLLVCAWNRIDSRAKGYRASVKVGGVEASVDTTGSAPPDPGRPSWD